MKIPVASPWITDDEVKAVEEVVRSGQLSMGPRVRTFEDDFASYTGANEALAVNNGTSALHVALAALGIGPGDEVVVPSLTFISTANVVAYLGAIPVLCECDPKTYNVTLDNLLEKVTTKTKAVIPVEMNGLPIDYDSILPAFDRLNIPVIVDSAESLGSIYKGKRVGSIAPIHCFSFFPNKIITTGEGGMITVSDAQLAQHMRQILNQGQDGRYHHVVLGYNYRMTEIQAAIGITQISKIDLFLEEKARIASRYHAAFQKTFNITPPFVPDYVGTHSWYMYAISVHNRDRDEIVKILDDKGIETRVSFPPIHTQPYYIEKFGYAKKDLPVTNQAFSNLIDIPIWPNMPEATQDEVIKSLIDSCEPK